MSTPSPARVSAGVPDGGQFATQHKPEAGIDLTPEVAERNASFRTPLANQIAAAAPHELPELEQLMGKRRAAVAGELAAAFPSSSIRNDVSGTRAVTWVRHRPDGQSTTQDAVIEVSYRDVRVGVGEREPDFYRALDADSWERDGSVSPGPSGELADQVTSNVEQLTTHPAFRAAATLKQVELGLAVARQLHTTGQPDRARFQLEHTARVIDRF